MIIEDIDKEYPYKETLEEFFYYYFIEQRDLELLTEEYNRDINVGSIIMANHGSNEEDGIDFTKPHRIYVISKIVDENGKKTYYGHILSSRTDKANIYNNKYPYNIYIDDAASIVGSRGTTPSIIKVDQVFKFTNDDLSESGVFKGNTVVEFRQFINKVKEKMRNNEDTSKSAWINNQGVFDYKV